MQIMGVKGGITTIEIHEPGTWTPLVGGTAPPVRPLSSSLLDYLTYVAKIRDYRKEN